MDVHFNLSLYMYGSIYFACMLKLICSVYELRTDERITNPSRLDNTKFNKSSSTTSKQVLHVTSWAPRQYRAKR